LSPGRIFKHAGFFIFSLVEVNFGCLCVHQVLVVWLISSDTHFECIAFKHSINEITFLVFGDNVTLFLFHNVGFLNGIVTKVLRVFLSCHNSDVLGRVESGFLVVSLVQGLASGCGKCSRWATPW
jgi:hypothetical protein